MRNARLLVTCLAFLIPVILSAQEKKACDVADWPGPDDWQQTQRIGWGWGGRDTKALASARSVYFRWDDSIPEIDQAFPQWARQRWVEVPSCDADLKFFVRRAIVTKVEGSYRFFWWGTSGTLVPSTVDISQLKYLILGYDRQGRLVHWAASADIGWVWDVLAKMIKDGQKKIKK